MHIFQLWESDLDAFVLALDEYELKEEKDRKAIPLRQKANASPQKRKKQVAKKIQMSSEDSTYNEKPTPVKQAPAKKKVQNKEELRPLRERLAELMEKKANSSQ